MSTIENVSRRKFLTGGVVVAGALVLGVRYYPKLLSGATSPRNTNADHAKLNPSVYLGIDPDGTVWIVASRSEMGTTSRTTLPLIVADELDADWKRVKIEQAIGDKRYGDQNTDGSHSIRSFYDAMREAGATARFMLIQAAARQWHVPAAECETDLHVVVHRSTNRKVGYGELAGAAAKLPVPTKEELKFKPKTAWRYIGKGKVSYDLEALVTGKAIYGMDARVDGMVYASVERPPVIGGKVKSFDDKEALKVAGVLQTVPIDPFQPPPAFQPLGGIAVIADNTWAAFQGRKKLNIAWDNGPNETYNSDAYKNELRETSHNPAKVGRNIGDADAVFAKGGKIHEADYYVPLLAHASMEPMVALAEFKDGKATLWAPTQNPQAVQDIVSKELGIAKEDVICHVTLLGGGFGRKSKPVDVNAVYGDPAHLQQGWTDIPYDLPNLRIENGPAKAHVRIGWLRSVANIYHAFAIQCFTDELAHAAGRDPLDYLLDLIGEPRTIDFKGVEYPNYGASLDAYPWETGRLRHVTEMVAEKSGWGKRKHSKGSGVGIAAHRSFLSYVATVVEVEVNDQGEVRIPRVDMVVDAGLVVNPEATRAQFEGAAVFGTSVVRSGEITATKGAIDQSNFQDYPVARIGEAPFQTNVYIVDNDDSPAGVGEPGVPPFVAAFCNAIFAATGKRVRDLPITKLGFS